MNKDTVLATIIGLVLGLTITGIFLLGPSILRLLPGVRIPKISFGSPKKAVPAKSIPAATPKTEILTISSPLPDSIETNGQMVVSGVALPNATVVTSGQIGDDVTQAAADGKFAGRVTLSEGRNDIIVTAYIDNVPTARNVTVYYTQESL